MLSTAFEGSLSIAFLLFWRVFNFPRKRSPMILKSKKNLSHEITNYKLLTLIFFVTFCLLASV